MAAFEEFRDKLRKSNPGLSDREIGELFYREQAYQRELVKEEKRKEAAEKAAEEQAKAAAEEKAARKRKKESRQWMDPNDMLVFMNRDFDSWESNIKSTEQRVAIYFRMFCYLCKKCSELVGIVDNQYEKIDSLQLQIRHLENKIKALENNKN